VARLTRVRWAIEILFKPLKGTYGLDAIASGKRCNMEVPVPMGLPSLLLTRAMRRRIQELKPDEANRIPTLQFARAYAAYSWAFLTITLLPPGYSPDDYDPLRVLLRRRSRSPRPADRTCSTACPITITGPGTAQSSTRNEELNRKPMEPFRQR
jgi:hypothetical protein